MSVVNRPSAARAPVHLDGSVVKSCTVLAVQADGSAVNTVDSLRKPGDAEHPLQSAFREHHALQCGFCTPGMIMSALELPRGEPRAAAVVTDQRADPREWSRVSTGNEPGGMMTDVAPPCGYVLAADQGLAQDRPDLKASSGSTGGQLTVFTLLVDGGPPRRTHTREDESIYLLGGPGLTPGTCSCLR